MPKDLPERNWANIKPFDELARERGLKHLKEQFEVSENCLEGRRRAICAIIADLYFTEEDPDRKELLIEICWMAHRMAGGLKRKGEQINKLNKEVDTLKKENGSLT